MYELRCSFQFWLLNVGALTEMHVRFRHLDQRNIPGRILKGNKRNSRTLKELRLSSGSSGKIGRHFVAQILAEPEDLPEKSVVGYVDCM